ncbi:hypothetical protein PENNAL_c0001G04302 [Penicillium nalgiovense]|uniref:Uncharacterized protein n=1 Tax=Penicillium nalgiovense TaxID=60175 RepID=A0A1V6Z972_PENNA|nr:hypothetical protein PENNAL_c0001G04302 [Penicillium nalgiovense]
MASNFTQHETPAWVNSVVPGAYGLIGLVVVVALIAWAIRYLASDPQRALTNHFFRQVAEFEKAKKAKKRRRRRRRRRPGGWNGRRRSGGGDGLWRALSDASGNSNSSDGATRPILHIIVEESGASTAEVEAQLEEVNCDGVVLRWVRVPRGYRLPPMSKKASTLAEVVGALRGGK